MKIFLTVGTHNQQFDRLIKEMDRIAGKKKLVVFGQIGNSTYVPKNFAFEKFIPEPKYTENFEKADTIVSHGGAGAIIHAMEAKKRLVIVPRLKAFLEHTNNHQLDLTKTLEAHKKAIAIEKISDLEKALEKSTSLKPNFHSTKNILIKSLKNWLDKTEKK